MPSAALGYVEIGCQQEQEPSAHPLAPAAAAPRAERRRCNHHTVEDLDWLRRRGLADAIVARAAKGRPLLGICGGYQVLAEHIDDHVESGRGVVPGLGLLATTVVIAERKQLGQPRGSWLGHAVQAYEIHHGVTARSSTEAPGLEPFLDGWSHGSVWGTSWQLFRPMRSCDPW